MTPRVCLHRFMHCDAAREEVVLLVDAHLYQGFMVDGAVHILDSSGTLQRLGVCWNRKDDVHFALNSDRRPLFLDLGLGDQTGGLVLL